MRLLIDALPVPKDERILVGFGHAEDAAVYRLTDDRAIVTTIDVITPLVDDPATFGRIAATNALSDVYAMGGTGLVSLSFIGVPAGFPPEITADIARGGAEAALEAGAPVVGGHSIESRDLIFGLVAVGEAHPDRLFQNHTIEVGDQLVLTKALGTGALTTAVRADKLALDEISEAIAGMTQLNRDAVQPLHDAEVRAVTDITGFGLLGHAAEMAKASDVQLVIEQQALPELPRAREMLQRKQRTRGDKTNLAYARELGPVEGDPESLIRDAQTSGGLLAAVKPDRVDSLLAALKAAGYGYATRIGEAKAGAGILAK